MKFRDWVIAVVAFVGLPLAFSLVTHSRNRLITDPQSLALGERILRSRVEAAQDDLRDQYLEIKEWKMTRALERRRRILQYLDLEHMDIKAAGEKAVADEEAELKALLLTKDLLELAVRERQVELEGFLQPQKP